MKLKLPQNRTSETLKLYWFKFNPGRINWSRWQDIIFKDS